MIKASQLAKSFGSHRVLEDVSLDIAKGESIVIIGRSGGGKSVILKHLIGLLKPDSGQVSIDGRDIHAMRERELIEVRRKFGMLFQSAALFDSMTVEENVGFVLRREARLSSREVRDKVQHALELVNLGGTQHKKPSELSGGMRKRVGLARAIIYEPEILLYDEPTTGLDPVVSDSIDRLIVRIREQLKVTTVVVTHDMRSVRTVGQRVVMLHNGSVYASGTPDEMFSSRDPVIRRFVNGISDSHELEQ